MSKWTSCFQTVIKNFLSGSKKHYANIKRPPQGCFFYNSVLHTQTKTVTLQHNMLGQCYDAHNSYKQLTFLW